VGHLRFEPSDPSFELPGNRVLALQTGRRETNWMSSSAFWHLRGHTVVLRAEPTRDAYAPTLAAVRACSDHLPVVRAGRTMLRSMDPASGRISRIMDRLR
jgi:hypothetical protein